MNPIAALHVDGLEADPATFVVPDMGLSSARSAMRRHDFVMTIRGGAMAAYLAPAYAGLVAELRRDFEQYGGAEALSDAGFPPVERLIDFPAAVEAVLGCYLKDEFLGTLTWSPPNPQHYWFDDTTAYHTDGDRIRLHGICYSR